MMNGTDDLLKWDKIITTFNMESYIKNPFIMCEATLYRFVADAEAAAFKTDGSGWRPCYSLANTVMCYEHYDREDEKWVFVKDLKYDANSAESKALAQLEGLYRCALKMQKMKGES